MNSVNIADFFAGVGGIRLGFENASTRYKCTFTNEIDKYAIRTYEKNFPDQKVNSVSIVDLDTQDIPAFDVFMGGFPCQPFSIAGHRKGFDDDRGNLFTHIARILDAKRPKALFLENVKNLKGHDKGRTLQVISETLNDLGYTFRYKVLNSAKHGNIPQNRERIFIVGFLNEKEAKRFRFPAEIELVKGISDCLENTVLRKYYYTDDSKIYPVLQENITETASENVVYQFRRHYVRKNKSGVCPTLTANMGGGGHNVPIILDDTGRIRKLTPRECFNFQGFPNDFKLPTNSSDTQLYKQAGNSVTVTVIKRIARNILRAMDGKKTEGEKGVLVARKYAKLVFCE